MEGKLIFLGCGASMGVPVLGCHCAVCLSNSSFNKRLRPSVLLKIEKKTLIIDVGPDFRRQALQRDLTDLDGILFTHAHQDHTAGIDDLRPLYFKKNSPIPFLASEETAKDIHNRFHFIFKPPIKDDHFIPRLQLVTLPGKQGVIEFVGVQVDYSTFTQGHMQVNCFRFGEMAYLTDVKHFDEGIFEWLKGVKYLVISALRHAHSPLHLSVQEAVQFANRVGAMKAWLTHTSHELDYEKTNASLPSHIQLAYDGLEIDFNIQTEG